MLVCGAALEVNVTSDMDFFVSINQVLLLQQVYQKNIACFFVTDIHGDSSQATETVDKTGGIHLETPQVADSGLGSEISATINYKVMGSRGPKLSCQHTGPSTSTSCSKDAVSSPAVCVPLEILLTAGRISCMFYTHTFNVPLSATPAIAAPVPPPPPTPKSPVSSEHLLGPGTVPFNLLSTVYKDSGHITLGSDCSTEHLSASDTGSDKVSSSDLNQITHIVPYLYLYFSQPHTVVTVQPEVQKFEMSYYDVMVKGPPSGYTLPVEDYKLLPEYADFNEYWIETRAGQPHPKTGVPPSFFTLRISDFLNKPARVSLQMERPLKLNVSPDKLCLTQEIVQQIKQSLGFFADAPLNAQDSASSEKAGKSAKDQSMSVLSHLSWMNQFSLKTEQVVVLLEAKQTEQSPGIMTSLTSINMEVTLHQNDIGFLSEIVSSLSLKDLQLKTCYLKQTPLSFIGPSTLNLTMASQWCTHSGPEYLPKSVLTLETGLLLVHFGQEHLLCLNHFTEQFFKECESLFGLIQTGDCENKSPPISETLDNQEEFITLNSTDDLRTGRFRYIMDSAMTENHAGPNQIVFCNCDSNNNSTMTWCYEQARVLSHVTISPVPFSLPQEGQLPKEQPSKIPCTLQYWDSLVNQFFEFVTFTLSENESSSLHLPEVKPLNTSELTAAQMWRVVIHQKYPDVEYSLPSTPSGSETDEEAPYPCVLPASLAACIRVDSCFVPTLVPMVQVLVTMPMMMVKFSNHVQHLGKGVPRKLQPFFFNDNEPEDQEWAVLSLDSPAIMGSYWGGYASRTSFQFSCACQLDIVEYRYLTQQTVIQPFSLQGEVTVLPDGEYQLTSVDCSIDNLVVRVGKGAIHTLHCTAEAWKQILNFPAIATGVCDKIVFCHYIICNDTNCMIRFGQVGTSENHILKSREMYSYGWCSHKTSTQMLHLCVNGEAWHWCDPFSIDHEGRIVRTINTGTHNIIFIIKIKPLSNVQNQVIIRGQLLFSNRLSLPLEMKLVTSRRTDTELCMNLSPLDSEASLILDDGEVRYLRLRQIGVTSAWSQEVFICGDRMKDNRLVKIPVLDKSQLIHLWCQIFYQNHGTAIQKLIVFSPLFILKSHLPVPLYIDVDTPKLKYHQQVQVPSKGKAFQLHCQGGDIVHSLSFQMGENMQRSSPAMTISTGMIEQVDRTPLQNPVDIDHILLDWHADMSTTGWPYIKFHEDTLFDVPPTESISSFAFPPLPPPNSDPIGTSHSALSSLHQDSCSIDLDITLSECWPGCCTILLNITPSCLLTNNTCTDLVLIAPSDQHWNVPQGATFTPTGIQEYFQLGLEINGEVVTSGIIPLSEEEVAARRYRTDVGEVLYIDGYVHTAIFTKTKEGNRKAYFFTVNSSIQHKIRIITISERFSITNFSQSPYELQTICVPLGNGKAKLPTELTIVNLPRHKKSRFVDNFCPLSCWTLQLQTDQEDIELNEKTNFVHYIRLREISKEEPQHNSATNESHWSFPLRLIANEVGTRVTTAVPVQLNAYATTQPLVLSGHVQDGLTYFVLDADKSPGCLISNCCPFPISYGQTLMNLTISDVTVLEETELLDCLPTIEPGHCVHYTMPFLNSIFPEIPNSQMLPKLHVSACMPEDTSHPSWNNGIDILSQHDTFVHMPHASDIKVHVEQVNMTAYLILEPVSRADISAKEIRSRIKGKETKVLVKDKIGANGKKLAKKTSAFSSVFSLQKVNMHETFKLKDMFCFNCGCMFKSVRFVILDETSSSDTFGEILSVSMSTVFLAHYPVTNFQSRMMPISKTSTALCIGDIQIDNQLFHKAQYDFPVVLIRQEGHVMPAASLPPIDNQMSAVEKHAILKSASFLHLQVVMETDILLKKSSIVKALEISIQPLALFLEDAFIYRLLKELQAFIPTQLSVERSPPDNLKQIPSSIVQASDVINCPVRMQYLCIHPINTLLSVHASLKLFIASDHTPLSFGKFEKEEIFTSSYYLIRTMTMHYASGALVRAGIVVGSLEILGNPTGLIRNIGNGVADLFKLPFTGLTKGPGAFLAGVSQGMSSLLKNVTAGTLTSITNFASSVSRNMDRLSLDSGHLERQEESRRNRPAGLSDGLKQGLTGLGLSLLSAIAGIADQPIQGILSSQIVTENSLATGFVAGVGKGLVGVVTKPIGGAAEFLSQTGQGILHGVGLTRVPEARFKPRLDSVHQGKNASIKYIFKTLQSMMPDAKLLLAIEVIQFDVTGFGSKVVLLLTPELLFAYDSDDDMSAQMFTLSELECLPPNEDSDTSVLTFMWQDQNQKLDQQEQNPNKDRVTAFLDSASGYVPLPDLSSINQPPTGHHPAFNSPTHASDKTAAPYFEFRVEPHFKEAFLTLFRMAKNKMNGRGFPL